jgi:hypothetical protein
VLSSQENLLQRSNAIGWAFYTGRTAGLEPAMWMDGPFKAAKGAGLRDGHGARVDQRRGQGKVVGHFLSFRWSTDINLVQTEVEAGAQTEAGAGAVTGAVTVSEAGAVSEADAGAEVGGDETRSLRFSHAHKH